MGYDLHITRRRDWSDDGPEIAVREWLALIEADAELEPWPANGPHFALWKGAAAQDEEWLDWQEGNIYSKNPSPALIDKMVALAAQLNAKVQGDDGETYAGGSTPPQPFRPTLGDRMRAWVNRLRGPRAAAIAPVQLPFAAGDRVRDVWGKEAIVVAIDARAEHGLGSIRVRYDSGREVTYSVVGHPFTLIPISES